MLKEVKEAKVKKSSFWETFISVMIGLAFLIFGLVGVYAGMRSNNLSTLVVFWVVLVVIGLIVIGLWALNLTKKKKEK